MTLPRFLHGVALLAIVLLMSGTTADPDLWGHVRFGQDMLAAGAVRVPDAYSFTADRPWINHEWLSEIAMAVSFECLGAAGLNLLRIAIIGCVLALVWGASVGMRDRQRMLIVAAAAVGIIFRALPIRPQLFSLLLFTILLTLLASAGDRRSWRPLALVPPVMALWANMHGGWLVGLGMLGLWCLMSMRAASVRDRIAWGALPAAAAAATLINPYGYEMWTFLAETVRMDRPLIADWQPLYTMSYNLWAPYLAAVAVTAIGAMRMRSLAYGRELAVTVVLGILALRVSRLDAFFAIAAAFFAARVLGNAGVPQPAQSPRRASTRLAWAFAGCVAAASAILIPRSVTIPMDADSVPDAHVAGYVRAQRLQGRMLTFFDWGEYTIWHFGPDLKVSMDGRRETVYSAETVAAHMHFYLSEPDSWRYADTLDPDYVWIPKLFPVVQQLRARGWSTLCEGSSSILLTRRHMGPPCAPLTQARAAAAFPEL